MNAFINALGIAFRDHVDALLTAVAFLLVLAFVEFRLRDLFSRHEIREEKMHADSRNTSETAGSVAREANRRIVELFELQTLTQAQIASVSDDVRMHEKRLGAVEERLMRAALAVPHVHRREDDGL